jgi:hypothetical protein
VKQRVKIQFKQPFAGKFFRNVAMNQPARNADHYYIASCLGLTDYNGIVLATGSQDLDRAIGIAGPFLDVIETTLLGRGAEIGCIFE